MQLVVPATPSMVNILVPGSFLGLRGTKEIMILQSQSVENGLLTVTGESLPIFLNERMAWFLNPDYATEDVPITSEYTDDETTAGEIISTVVSQMVINHTLPDIHYAIELDWDREMIKGLELGIVDANGEPKRLSVAIGPLYESIQKVAVDEGVGFKLYLESATYSTSTYVLKFATYRGKNRTSEQTVHGVVRLSPKLDSLNDVKEISSIKEYKNVVYVFHHNGISTHYIGPDLPIPEGFDRRALLVNAPDIYVYDPKIPAFLEQVARNALLNHVYIKAVDGKVSPQIDYVFGKDYYLGDVVELEGYSGIFSKARITEFIRSEDQFGMQAYPTLAVIDPLETGYMPDLEPDPDVGPDVNEDPNFDMDMDFDDDGFEWNPDGPGSDYDIEHDPVKEIDPEDPRDPNPDPFPSFPVDEDAPYGSGGGDGGPGKGDGAPSVDHLIVAYSPDQNNGAAIGYLTIDGQILPAWIYVPEDNNPDIGYRYDEIIPLGWTLDHQHILAQSDETKDITDAFPWENGKAFWLMNHDGSRTRLTETLPSDIRVDGVFGGTHAWASPGVFWCGAADNGLWYLSSKNPAPPEYLYADGTYSINPEETIHGVRLNDSSRGPIELYSASRSGSSEIELSQLAKTVGVDDLPPYTRWSAFGGPYISPDGNKLCFSKAFIGPQSIWQIGGTGGQTGGTFAVKVGYFGNAVGDIFETIPLAWDATDEDIWEALLISEHLSDPRLHGDPAYVPYSGAKISEGHILLKFYSEPVPGTWLDVDSTNIESSFGGYGVLSKSVGQRGDPYWFMCDNDGENVEAIDFGIVINQFGGWNPDSSKLHALVPSNGGANFCRWMNYDVDTQEVSYPLDYSSEPLSSDGNGQLTDLPIFSPNGDKIVFLLKHNNDPVKLMVANSDGSNVTEVYTDFASPERTDLVLSSQISWSFDSSKLAIVDARPESPVSIINLTDNTITQIWPGSGWGNSDDQKWIHNPQNFDGG